MPETADGGRCCPAYMGLAVAGRAVLLVGNPDILAARLYTIKTTTRATMPPIVPPTIAPVEAAPPAELAPSAASSVVDGTPVCAEVVCGGVADDDDGPGEADVVVVTSGCVGDGDGGGVDSASTWSWRRQVA